MDNILIRKATLNDLLIIQKLNNELFKLEKENYDPTLIENWPLQEEGKKYFEDLIKKHYVIVAVINQEVIGYLAGSINQKGSYEEIQYAELNNMLIKKQYRNYGIGEKLMVSFKEHCKQNNIYNLKVIVSAKNNGAINFYKRQGFENFNLTLTMNIDK